MRTKELSCESFRAAERGFEVDHIAGNGTNGTRSTNEIVLIGRLGGVLALLHALNSPHTGRTGILVEASLGHIFALFVWRAAHSR